MNLTIEQIRRADAARRMLTIGLGAHLLAGAAIAQESTNVARQTITGTRLSAAEVEGALSVTAVDTTTPMNAGFPTIGDILRVKLPQLAGPGIVNEAFANGGDGSSTISLRGLPANATLVLVNGRRVSTEDLNLLPEAAIERIDVLNDGASTIYGNDAVAGVVNVVLRQNFNGLRISSFYGNTFDTDVGQRRFQLLWGTSTENTSVVFSADYSAANSMFSVDRERSRPLPNAVSGTSNPGLFSNPNPGAGNTPLRWRLNVTPGMAMGLTNAAQIPAAFNPLAVINTAGLSATQRNAARDAEDARLNSLLGPNSPVRYGPNAVLFPGGQPGFPFGFYTPVYRPYERYNANASITHKIFGENLEVFANSYYVRNQSFNQLAPSPLAGQTLPSSNYWYKELFGATATGPLRFSYRPVEFGPRQTFTDFETFHNVFGLKGRINESSWKWETAFMYDRTSVVERQTGGVVGANYDKLLADGTPNAFNVFGYTPIGGVSPVVSGQTLSTLSGTAYSYSADSIFLGDAHVGGQVFDLPAGAVEATIGGEYRQVKGSFEPDVAIQNGLIRPFNVVQPLIASRDIHSFFGEVSIPVLSKDQDVPLVHSFNVATSGRYESFSDVGVTGYKPAVNFRWQPIDKQLTIRGSYAQGYIAPGFGSLYQLPGQDFTELFNPVTKERKQPEEAVLTIGNPRLKPTDSETFLIGFVTSPDKLKGFTTGASYYRIQQTGIPFASAQYIVNQWYANGADTNPNNPFGANAGISAANPLGSQVELNALGDLYQVRNVGAINSGTRTTDGIDIQAGYEYKTDVGTFGLNGNATRILTFEQENFPGSGAVGYLGKYWAPGAALEDAGFPEWRSNLTFSYQYDRYTFAFAWNYTDGYRENVNGGISPADFDPNNPDNAGALADIPSYQTYDLRLTYRIHKVEADFTFGINNLLDEAPPQVQSTFGDGYDRRLTDIRGRQWFVQLSRQF